MLLRELERIKPESTNNVKKEEMDEDDDNKENSQAKAQAKEIGWEQTSLKPYVDMFDKHIAAIIKDNVRAKKGERESSISVANYKLARLTIFLVLLACLLACRSCQSRDFRLLDPHR